MNEQIKADIKTFLEDATSRLTDVCDVMRALTGNIRVDEKLGAQYRVIGMDITQRIWHRIANALDTCMRLQDVAEHGIYTEFCQLKEDHEKLLAQELPADWYGRVFDIVLKDEAQLKTKIHDCIQKYAEIAQNLSERCAAANYPHGEQGFVDGRDFIKFALTMDIPTFWQILTVRRKNLFDKTTP